MKKYLLIISFILFASDFCFSQINAGTEAPDFKVYEIDKSTGNLITDSPIQLYEYLEEGKTVFIDFSAIWCGPCWEYHETHAMSDAYNLYGPEGTDELRVLFIEGSYGNYESLSGSGKDYAGRTSQGNWLEDTPYPVVPVRMPPNYPDASNITNDYGIMAFPTFCMICPDKEIIYYGNAGLTVEEIYGYVEECIERTVNSIQEKPTALSTFHLVQEGNIITIKSNTDLIIDKMDVFDSLGKLIKTEKINNSRELDLRYLPQGLYILQFSTNNGNVVRKITKQ